MLSASYWIADQKEQARDYRFGVEGSLQASSCKSAFTSSRLSAP